MHQLNWNCKLSAHAKPFGNHSQRMKSYL
uniref:Uncharacterized protein n=1 Tax=Rhizophora mucronata TaxID=61149 RepID=A0A2P2N213_RHIMU